MTRVGKKLKKFAVRALLGLLILSASSTSTAFKLNIPQFPSLTNLSTSLNILSLQSLIFPAHTYYTASYDIELNFFNEPQMNFALNGFESKKFDAEALLAQNPSAPPEDAQSIGGNEDEDHDHEHTEESEKSLLGELLEKPVNLPASAPNNTGGSENAPVAQETGFKGGESNTGRYLNWPVAGYNYVSRCGIRRHPAIDIAGSNNNILAAAAGTVTYAGCTPFGRCRAQGFASGGTDLGWVIKIDHGNGYETMYAHLRNIYVTPGQVVEKGDWIGQMGSTGNSTGPHLHFSLVRYGQWFPEINPGPYISSTRVCG